MRLSTLFTLSKNRAAHNQRPQAARQIPVFHREPRVKAPECPGMPKPPECQSHRSGGAGRDRTDDLSSAIAALSQLSYGPRRRAFREWPPGLSSERRAKRVVGIDFSAAMLQIGQSKIGSARASAPPITLVRGDAMRIPLLDESVDAATIGFGIRNVEQPAVAWIEEDGQRRRPDQRAHEGSRDQIDQPQQPHEQRTGHPTKPARPAEPRPCYRA